MDIPVDFIVITPLEEERDALLAKLNSYSRIPPSPDDIRTYFAAELPVQFTDGTSGAFRLIIVPLPGMGRLDAAIATVDAIRRWRPRYVIVIGIAGGLARARVRLGDVLIANQIADGELQRLESQHTSIRWQVHRVDPRLLLAAQNLMVSDWRPLVQAERPVLGVPNRFVGVICTGDKIIANSQIETYVETWPKLIGVEMEAGGAASAAFQATPAPGFFMIRGVSDLADPEKDTPGVNCWREYACDVAASFFVGLLKSGLVPLSPTGEAPHRERDSRLEPSGDLFSNELVARPDPLKVFVASKMRRAVLSQEREAAIDAIDSVGFARAWAWERDGFGGCSVEATCLAQARSSDCLVLILGQDVSGLALREYHEAVENRVPCYILVKDGRRRSPELSSFLEEERERAWALNFRNLSELKSHLVAALWRRATTATRFRNLCARSQYRGVRDEPV